MADPHQARIPRREWIAGFAAVAATTAACRPEGGEAPGASLDVGGLMQSPHSMDTMPTIYLPHGGGPWPWTPPFSPALGVEYRPLRAYLESLSTSLPRRPRGIVIVSAHWEAQLPTVTAGERPDMLYDYYGFPAEAYRIRWDAPGSPTLTARVGDLLAAAGIESAETSERGFDHGTFIPMKLAFPEADIPTVQLSLDASYDPARHIAIGRALSGLREEGILIVGSGMSFENFRARDLVRCSSEFDAWFRDTAVAAPEVRDARLRDWTSAPHARTAHPHEEHLLPMMVAAGAAGMDRGRIAFTGSLMGIRVSAVQFERVSNG